MGKKYGNRKHRGTRALLNAAKTVRYELTMARFSAELIKRAKKTHDKGLYNAALESLLVHGRNIREFFRRNSRIKNDILIKDFFGRTPQVNLDYLKKNINRINKRLAHLSYSRPYMKDEWDDELILKEIEDAMREFVARLQLSHRALAKQVFAKLRFS